MASLRAPTPVAVPLENAVEGERVVVRIVYFTSAPGTLRIQAGESDEVAPLRSSVNTLYVVVSGRVDEVTLTLQEDLDDGGVPSTAQPGTVCAVNLAVGFPAVRGGTS